MEKLDRAKAPGYEEKQKYIPGAPLEAEIWMNDTYTVFVYRHQESGFKSLGLPVLLTWLSIKRNDRSAKPDWRDFQWIKNQLVGEENEGVELYPAESRLVDGANQFHLWVFENPDFKMPFGFGNRMVSEKSFFGETQRKFPESRKPHDLELHHQFIEDHKKTIDKNSITQ